MKKLFLSVAALLCATLMFSQNTSDVKQTGLANDAIVDQQGHNFSDVEQDGYSNLAAVTQDGDGYAGDPLTAQHADVYQEGDMNDAAILQGDGVAYGNDAEVDQYGYSNVSRQTQMEDNNTADVYQRGTGNLAVQEQTSVLNGTSTNGNTASIRQTGFTSDGNGTYNVAYQTQDGKGNVAEITQWTYNQYASQLQMGDDNFAKIRQDSDGDQNYATQEQWGIGNEARADQNWYSDYTDAANSGDNLSQQFQSGDYNSAFVAQDRGVSWSVTAGGDTFDTKTIISSGSKANSAFQNQYDMNHRAYSHQSGMYNLSLQEQHGDGNFSFIQQDGYSNYATDYQSGDGHRSGVYQLGAYNESYVTQNGSLHTSKVDQDGDYNKSTVVQND